MSPRNARPKEAPDEATCPRRAGGRGFPARATERTSDPARSVRGSEPPRRAPSRAGPEGVRRVSFESRTSQVFKFAKNAARMYVSHGLEHGVQIENITSHTHTKALNLKKQSLLVRVPAPVYDDYHINIIPRSSPDRFLRDREECSLRLPPAARPFPSARRDLRECPRRSSPRLPCPALRARRSRTVSGPIAACLACMRSRRCEAP